MQLEVSRLPLSEYNIQKPGRRNLWMNYPLLKEKGFVEESMSPWAAPMFPIPKKDGSIRLAIDYRWLNQVTEADPYSMPRIEVLLEQMVHAHLFTTQDLRKGYCLWTQLIESTLHLLLKLANFSSLSCHLG